MKYAINNSMKSNANRVIIAPNRERGWSRRAGRCDRIPYHMKKPLAIEPERNDDLPCQTEQPLEIMKALKASIVRSPAPEERSYQRSGLEFSHTIEVPLDDSLKKIQTDVLELQRGGETELQRGGETGIGTGAIGARILIISDRPKPDEVKDGFIFQGRISELFSTVLTRIDQADCYSCYAIKHECSPRRTLLEHLRDVPLDAWKYMEEFEFGESLSERDYKPEDLEGYRSILLREVLVVRPLVIIALGGIAAKILLDTDDLVADLRNRIHTLRINKAEFSVLVTFDLEYLHFLTEHFVDFKEDLDLLKILLSHICD